MEAIQCSKNGDFEQARELMQQASEKLIAAHAEQTKLIQAETRGEKTEVTLLLIHAQDHLMTSIVVKDLANELIDVHEKLA